MPARDYASQGLDGPALRDFPHRREKNHRRVLIAYAQVKINSRPVSERSLNLIVAIRPRDQEDLGYRLKEIVLYLRYSAHTRAPNMRHAYTRRAVFFSACSKNCPIRAGTSRETRRAAPFLVGANNRLLSTFVKNGRGKSKGGRSCEKAPKPATPVRVAHEAERAPSPFIRR